MAYEFVCESEAKQYRSDCSRILNHPSFVVYVEAVNEVYNKYFNGGGWHNVQSIL